MEIRRLSPFMAVSDQIQVSDVPLIASRGFKTIVNNRPDGEESNQPPSASLREAAEAAGLAYVEIPVQSGGLADNHVSAFAEMLARDKGPVLAFCRSGMRSTSLWALAHAAHLSPESIIKAAADAGYDISGLSPKLQAQFSHTSAREAEEKPRTGKLRIVIVGGGAGGVATAASLLKRRPALEIILVEPRTDHYYQPGWTLVGGGVFRRADTVRAMKDVIPAGVKWVRAAVAGFEPEKSAVVLEDGERLNYDFLVAAPGLKLNWRGVAGLEETLGRNGVTSNYQFDLAPYTWELVQGLNGGEAVFTQPPMPIKCAGAPQKAMYLSCDAWRRRDALSNINVRFHNAGAVLFGVAAYVPALMEYVDKYAIDLNFNSNLIAVDGPARRATFLTKDSEGVETKTERSFDMLHVCPPQTAPDFVSASPLAGAGGWIDVNQETLQHPRYANVFALGDACGAPNAKTAAAVRKQAPVVAENILALADGRAPECLYDGYGSCPLTVERGKIVLAEFGYGGKLLPSFPRWVVDGQKPTRLAWFLKEKMLPSIYWNLMLKGEEWLARPKRLPLSPATAD